MFAADFYEQFGYDRPLYSVGHDGLFMGPLADPMTRLGIIRANQEKRHQRLADRRRRVDFSRRGLRRVPADTERNVIDFKGRTGYVKSAIEAGVPIVPTVSIGAQESQLFLSRGRGWRNAWG